MHRNEDGHATMELLMLVPLILLILVMITITGEFYYMDNRTILASKCLILQEYNQYYDHLRMNRESGNSDAHTYTGQEDLEQIFFPGKEARFDVNTPHATGMSTDDEGTSHSSTAESPSGLESSTWNSMVGVVNEARGKTWASADIQFAPTLFWPESYSTLSDSVYLAAADWRYDELPGGYFDLVKRRISGLLEKVGL